MLLPDVNVLVYAHRRESPDHDSYRQWLDELLNGPANFAMSELALSGFVRVVTNPRAFATPTPPSVALDVVAQVTSSPACQLARPGPRHLGIFVDLCRSLSLRGNDVSDAYHAALAIETGSELVTTDRGFARFPGLRWSHPLHP